MSDSTTNDNPKSIMICGESGHGKSASLMDLADRKDVIYFNCENGKPLPFRNKFRKVNITDPEDIIDYIEELTELEKDEDEENPFRIAIIDTASFMMDMYESVHVIGSANTQAAWGNYGQFFPRLMLETAKSNMFFIFLAHLDSHYDEDEQLMKFSVPVKGALKAKGLESRFTTVLYVKRMRVKDIKKGVGEGSDLLKITPKEEAKGFKHVFLTDSDKSTIGGRIRTPMGMFSDEELYINNAVGPVLQRLEEYYNG